MDLCESSPSNKPKPILRYSFADKKLKKLLHSGRIVGFEQAAPPPSIMEKISGSTSNGKKGKNRSMAIDLDVPGGRDDDEDEEEDGCEEALLKVSTDKDQEEDDDDEGFKKIVKAEIENGQDIKPDVKPSAVQKQEKDRMSTGPEWPLVEVSGNALVSLGIREVKMLMILTPTSHLRCSSRVEKGC